MATAFGSRSWQGRLSFASGTLTSFWRMAGSRGQQRLDDAEGLKPMKSAMTDLLPILSPLSLGVLCTCSSSTPGPQLEAMGIACQVSVLHSLAMPRASVNMKIRVWLKRVSWERGIDFGPDCLCPEELKGETRVFLVGRGTGLSRVLLFSPLARLLLDALQASPVFLFLV